MFNGGVTKVLNKTAGCERCLRDELHSDTIGKAYAVAVHQPPHGWDGIRHICLPIHRTARASPAAHASVLQYDSTERPGSTGHRGASKAPLQACATAAQD